MTATSAAAVIEYRDGRPPVAVVAAGDDAVALRAFATTACEPGRSKFTARVAGGGLWQFDIDHTDVAAVRLVTS
ncbi:hypothetical protein [Dactylosporangium salmoneum]|uniref:Uncharacterized protein n=1 Tax=Dactylosporangium salmoneum TaxID=53361 RepID=A0ABN3GAP4_9ACTN